MLKLDALSCGYGAVRAVHDLSAEVPMGSVLALLGPNGAGKTSTIMAIMGHIDIHAGRILYDGADITRRRAVDRTKLGIALVPEGRQLFPDLTVEENLTVGGYAHPLARDRINRARVFHFFPRLGERKTQLAGSLSGGEQQMLAIGRALMTRPRLLMLDEPSQGIMPKLVDEIFQAVKRIRDAGMTVLIVEQRMAECLDIADRAYILQTGRVLMQGAAAEIKTNPDVRKAYLGL